MEIIILHYLLTYLQMIFMKQNFLGKIVLEEKLSMVNLNIEYCKKHLKLKIMEIL